MKDRHMKLNNQALKKLPQDVVVPSYQREDVSAGIIHIGVGNFHRSHQAMYMNRLFNQGKDLDWGIVGAGVMPSDAGMRARLADQDFLYSVVELDPNDQSTEVCGALIDFAEPTRNSVFAALCQPEIRIVSLTITEGGYYIDPTTGGFDHTHEAVIAESARKEDPQTVFGLIVKALKFRKEKGLGLFTILSCDNVPENGHVTRNAVLGIATLIAPELTEWIAETIAFPNSMVDRITPATTERDVAFVKDHFGYQDECVVVCEPFTQWVIEDNFPQGRPALEEVGVAFVEDVALYELMKLRILNASHAAIAYPSYLLGIHYVHDAMASPVIVDYLDKLETEEAIPTLPLVEGVNFQSYFQKAKERFANPKIADTIERLCMDGSNRQPKFIFQTIQDRLKHGEPVTGLALEVALWCRYCAGVNEQGEDIQVNDINAARLKEKAQQAKLDPASFLQMIDIFGHLAEEESFLHEFSTALKALWDKGTAQTLKQYADLS